MSESSGQRIIISLGGSLIVPGDIDVAFLKDFKTFIESYVARGFSFVIVTGGGKTARTYQKALSVIANPVRDDLDWVGVAALRLNAMLVKNMFGKLAYSEVVNDPELLTSCEEPIIIGGACATGASTDLGTTLFAKHFGATKLINLSNIDHAYDKDPNVYSDAKKIEEISWEEFRKLIPTEWDPGASAPFDPIASKLASELGIEVAVMNGKNLDNLAAYLDGEAFVGTRIYS